METAAPDISGNADLCSDHATFKIKQDMLESAAMDWWPKYQQGG